DVAAELAGARRFAVQLGKGRCQAESKDAQREQVGGEAEDQERFHWMDPGWNACSYWKLCGSSPLWIDSLHSPLQLLQELRAELRHFRRDDCPAVPLLRMLPEVALVIILRGIEPLQRHHLGHDRPLPDVGLVQFADYFVGNHLLLRRVEEDGRAVLGALIGALPVQRGRVVNDEKDLQQLAERDHVRVEGDLHHLRVPSRAAADLAVTGVGHAAAGVAGFDLAHAAQLLEHRFQAPEAAPGKGRDFGTRLFWAHGSILPSFSDLNLPSPRIVSGEVALLPRAPSFLPAWHPPACAA